MVILSSGPDFKSAAAAALHSARELVRTWYPAGKFRGREYVVGDLSGNPGESLSINVETGQWADFATGESGGDLISLYAARHRIGQADALAALADGLAISPSIRTMPSQPAPKSTWRSLVPPPDAPAPNLSGFDSVYVYRNADGLTTHYVGRREPRDGRRKTFSGITWGELNGQIGWHYKQILPPRPLYNLDQIAARPDATVLVCEGEKAADAASTLLPAYVATTWTGGANNTNSADWTPLSGRYVLIWPDNDEEGTKAASAIQDTLQALGCQVLRLDVSDLPEKADAADVSPSDPDAWVARRIIRPAQPEEPPGDDPAYFRAIDEEAESKPKGRGPIGEAIDDVMRRFNARYLIVNEGGKALVYQPRIEPVLKRRIFDRMTFEDLKRLYMNDMIECGLDATGKVIRKSAAQVWLTHPGRRQYIHGVTFDPSMQTTERGILNLWEGYAIKPKAGDWKLLRSHLLSIICRGNQEHFDYLIRWLARMLQFPADQGNVAVVMRGGEGIGKGTVAKALLRIIGHHGIAISNAKHLVGNFNAHLRDVVFLFADEAFFAGDKQHQGVLKNIITEEFLTVEAKYANAQQTPNFLHVIMASNEEWVVPASLDSRRFFVLDVDPAAKGDHGYFKVLNEEMEQGGLAAMLHDLLALDLSTFNVWDVPTTEGLQTQRKLSLGTSEAWWLDCLERGYILRSKLGLEDHFGQWHERVTTELLFSSYTEFAKARNERRPMTREMLGKFLVRFGLTPCRIKNGITGEHRAAVDGPYGDIQKAKPIHEPNPRGYRVSPLAMSREDFVEIAGLSIDWGDNDEQF